MLFRSAFLQNTLRFNGPNASWTDTGIIIPQDTDNYLLFYFNRNTGEVSAHLNGKEVYNTIQSGLDEGDFDYYVLGNKSTFNGEYTPGIYYCAHAYDRKLANNEIKQN